LCYSYSEVIGYIDGIESPRIVGNKQQYKFFKFYLNNGNGRKIQIVAWNDDIDYILPLIMPNHVNKHKVIYFISNVYLIHIFHYYSYGK